MHPLICTRVWRARLAAACAAVCAAASAGEPLLPGGIGRGRVVFEARCVLCHGVEADGNGQMARLLDPHPANLQRSVLDDAARNAIVRHGGASVGRSAAMPRWEAELEEQQLRDVIAYVASVAQDAGRRAAP